MRTFDESGHRRDQAGKFASKTSSESGVELGGPGAGSGGGSSGSGSCDAYDAWDDGGDWRSEVEEAGDPDLAPDRVRDLGDPLTRPRSVRLALASSGARGAAERCADDPSGTVRTIAASHLGAGRRLTLSDLLRRGAA